MYAYPTQSWCWKCIFLHFLKTHAGSAKAAIGKSGLTNKKLYKLQICISLIPMPLPDFISRPGSEARYAYQKGIHHFTICRCYDKALGSWVGATKHSYQLHCSRAHWGYWGNEKTRYVHSLKPVLPVISCSMLKEGLSLIPSLHASALSVVEWTACRMLFWKFHQASSPADLHLGQGTPASMHPSTHYNLAMTSSQHKMFWFEIMSPNSLVHQAKSKEQMTLFGIRKTGYKAIGTHI